MRIKELLFGYRTDIEYWIPLKDVVIKYNFQLTCPNPTKFKYKENLFKNKGVLGRIILNKNFELIDGYCSYLIYKKYGIEKIPVWFVD